MQILKNKWLLTAFTIAIWCSFFVICSDSFIVLPCNNEPQHLLEASSIRRETRMNLNAGNNNSGGDKNDWFENMKNFWQGGTSGDNNERTDDSAQNSMNEDLAAGTSRILTIPGMFYDTSQ